MVNEGDVDAIREQLRTAALQLEVDHETVGLAEDILRRAARELSTYSHGPDNSGAGALLVACRANDEAVTMNGIVDAWDPTATTLDYGEPFRHSNVGRAFAHFSRALDIETSLTGPEDHIDRAAETLELSEETHDLAVHILRAVKRVAPHIVGSVTPNGAAAAAVYLAGRVSTEDSPTQTDVSDALETTNVTLRHRRNDFRSQLAPQMGEEVTADKKFTSVTPEQVFDIPVEETSSGDAGGLPGEASEEYVRNASVLFGDLRNFTSIVQLYDGAYETIDQLFTAIEARITEEYGGEVDKLLGDGILAVWTGPDAAREAVECATSIIESDLADLRTDAPFEVAMGFGIATGELRRVDIGGVDRTIFGATVNLASRLEGLCKRYDAQVVVDEGTANALDDEVPMYHVPARELRGFNEEHDVSVVPVDDPVPEDALASFNQAAADLDDGYYAEALQFFASTFGARHHAYNDALLETLTVECFERFTAGEGRHDASKNLYQYTETQRRRAEPLRDRVTSLIEATEGDDVRVLEVGCGEGTLLRSLAADHPDVTFVGIDTDPVSIDAAEAPDDENASFVRTSPDRLSPDAPFDIVYLNAPLYSDPAYYEDLTALTGLTASGGSLLAQQAPPSFAQPLRDRARDAALEMRYMSMLDRFSYPIDFPTEEELVSIYEERGWSPTVTREAVDLDPSTFVDDFVTVGLTPYVREFANAVEKTKFKSAFRTTALQATGELPGEVFLVEATRES